ncbi:histidine phosphatase [Chloropicon primus]|nr:histidine phosphatase [Chloropicon primus]
MASTKRPRESLEDKCDGVDTFNHQENVDRRTGLETKSQRRRSSCVRAGEFFLRQLENESKDGGGAYFETPLKEGTSSAGASLASPLALPSLRKLRFRRTPAKVEEEERGPAMDEDDGFVIHCSQNYERSHDEPQSTAEEATPERVNGPQQEAVYNDTTPPVTGRCGEIQCGKCDRKKVIIVRHGESVYNALDRYSRSLEDPFVFDAALTDLGKQQAASLRPTLLEKLPQSGQDGSSPVLFVASPLTRCIQTLLGALPSALDGKVAICSLMAEHLATTGDIGRPKSHLVKDFPNLKEALEEALEERWWWQPNKNCAIEMKFESREPKKNLQKRVGLFRQWVLEQPQKVIVAFGHSTFWKEFSGSDTRLGNCEVDTVYL